MKRYLRILLILPVLVLTLTTLVFSVSWALGFNVLGWALTSATPIVGLLGDKIPELSTPYGVVKLHSEKVADGLAVDIECSECRINHPRLSESPFLTSSARIKGKVVGQKFTGTGQIEGVIFPVDVRWQGSETKGTVILVKQSLSEIYKAVASIVPEYDEAEIGGEISGKISFSWPNFQLFIEPKISGFTVDGLVDRTAYQYGPISYQAKDESGEPINVVSGEGSPRWVPFTELGSHLPEAVLAMEDQSFFDHAGYNVKAISEATKHNRREGEDERGGSTITQQLAKNLFLSNQKTYARKLSELLFAVEMDRELGKLRILELYLNIVEWAPGVFGAQSASALYFNKKPSELLPEEAAWLATILRSPKRGFAQEFQKGRPNQILVKHVLEHMPSLSAADRAAALSRAVFFAKR